MRNKRTELIFALLALTLLLPWPVASAHDASDDVAGHVANVYSIVPNDKYFDKQWALTKIQAPEANQRESGVSVETGRTPCPPTRKSRNR